MKKALFKRLTKVTEPISSSPFRLPFSFSFSFSFSLPPSVTQEAVAWIESLPGIAAPAAMATGEFIFKDVPIRADLLAHLVRENCVVKLSMFSAETSSSDLASLFNALMHSDVITTLDLRLGSIDIDEMALNALATLMRRSKSIVEYHLRHLNIQDDGVALICDALAENNVIEELDLWQNGIGVEGARSLARLMKADGSRSCATLDLAANSIGDEGVVALVDGLRGNTGLRKLNLSGCKISDQGAIALASLLSHGSHHETLFLQLNEIKEAGVKALANALKHNRNLCHLRITSWFVPRRGEIFESSFIEALQSNVTLIELQGIKSSKIEALLLRNKEHIPAAVRLAALLLIGIRQSTDIEGMGDFAVFPKDIVRLIAQTVWATRRDPIWIQALK